MAIELLIRCAHEHLQAAIALPTSEDALTEIAFIIKNAMGDSSSPFEIDRRSLMDLLERLIAACDDTPPPKATGMFEYHRDSGTIEGASGMTGLSWDGEPIMVTCNSVPGRCVIKGFVDGKIAIIADITGMSRFRIDNGYIDAAPMDHSLALFKTAVENAIQLVRSSKTKDFAITLG